MNSKGLTLAALLGLSSLSMPAAAPRLPKTNLATHDVGGNGCRSCHAPHNGSTANGGTQGTGAILLWTRSFPAAANTFLVYDSATMVNKTVELGGAALTASTDARMYSLLCLSCHDGVTSSFSPAMQSVNQVGSKAGTVLSLGLSNDHPVNMPHDPIRNTSLRDVATVTASLPLYGSNNSVQCGTCHDPHNNINTHFLRQPNTAAGCTTCHL